MEESYPKGEIDLMHKAFDTEIKHNHREIMVSLKEQKAEVAAAHSKLAKAISDVDAKITFTNGKVKRIIIALTAIGAFALGTGLQNISTLIKIVI